MKRNKILMFLFVVLSSPSSLAGENTFIGMNVNKIYNLEAGAANEEVVEQSVSTLNLSLGGISLGERLSLEFRLGFGLYDSDRMNIDWQLGSYFKYEEPVSNEMNAYAMIGSTKIRSDVDDVKVYLQDDASIAFGLEKNLGSNSSMIFEYMYHMHVPHNGFSIGFKDFF